MFRKLVFLGVLFVLVVSKLDLHYYEVPNLQQSRVPAAEAVVQLALRSRGPQLKLLQTELLKIGVLVDENPAAYGTALGR